MEKLSSVYRTFDTAWKVVIESAIDGACFQRVCKPKGDCLGTSDQVQSLTFPLV